MLSSNAGCCWASLGCSASISLAQLSVPRLRDPSPARLPAPPLPAPSMTVQLRLQFLPVAAIEAAEALSDLEGGSDAAGACVRKLQKLQKLHVHVGDASSVRVLLCVHARERAACATTRAECVTTAAVLRHSHRRPAALQRRPRMALCASVAPLCRAPTASTASLALAPPPSPDPPCSPGGGPHFFHFFHFFTFFLSRQAARAGRCSRC
jgi:hypothetical protein